MKWYELKCEACETIDVSELTEKKLNLITTNPHKFCTETPHGKVSVRELKIITKPIPNNYKEMLEEYRVSLEDYNHGPISDDIIIYLEQSLEEKIKFVESLHNKALLSMKEPTTTLSEGSYWVTKVGNLKKDINILNARKNQLYSCLLCGIGPHPKYNRNIKEEIAKYVLKLEPHEIVYKNFKGDYVPENIVMLCRECHDKEYKLFKEYCWDEMFKENGKAVSWQNLNWEKLIEKSFDCFKRVIT